MKAKNILNTAYEKYLLWGMSCLNVRHCLLMPIHDSGNTIV